MSGEHAYILMTAARNEASFIERTLDSVANQIVPPKKWVIVNDGSVDATGEIVAQYQAQHPWILLYHRKSGERRGFGSKARAIQAAFSVIKDEDYAFIGTLDADISFEANFYQNLIKEFEQDRTLGLVGGTIWEQSDGLWKCAHRNPEWSVGGGTQFFRRDVFEKLGTYPPLRHGGEDTVIEYLVREMGYRVKAISDRPAFHHRPQNFSMGKGLLVYFKLGMQEYFWGSDPTFELAKCFARIPVKPVAIGSGARLAGFLWATLLGLDRDIDSRIVRIIRKQQRARMKADLVNIFRRSL